MDGLGGEITFEYEWKCSPHKKIRLNFSFTGHEGQMHDIYAF